ncbi:NAD-dependent epimerase/dehydratase family protein [Actinomycetospora aeridis]|uniref:NAD-dependent epimerase/dehydratase family protein n=1 Tax=Actinomycetospora aeridis TaxID=3129231 RepID=A0ABU8N3A4_9PSEU
MLLVTGATGFVGSAVAAYLHEQGHPVRAVVRDPSRADVLPDGVERVAADLADADSLARAIDGCEGVFHLAAAVGAPGPEARELNVGGTRRVVDAARRAGVRLVHTSTSAAVCVPDPDGPGCVVDEDAAGGTALTDTYSLTKAEAEAVVLDAVAEDGLDAVVATVVNVYGPSPRGPLSYNQLFAAAARGEVGDIVDTRVGWTLAEDVAAGQLLAFTHGRTGRRYVLCGEIASFPEVLDTYCELAGSPHRVRALPGGSELGPDAPPFADRSVVYGRLGGYRVRDDGARALGAAPRGIADGLALTARWMPRG